MVVKPFFDPAVIVAEVVLIPSPPAGIVSPLMGFLAVGISTGLLAFTHPWVRGKQPFAITAPVPFHPRPFSIGS